MLSSETLHKGRYDSIYFCFQKNWSWWKFHINCWYFYKVFRPQLNIETVNAGNVRRTNENSGKDIKTGDTCKLENHNKLRLKKLQNLFINMQEMWELDAITTRTNLLQKITYNDSAYPLLSWKSDRWSTTSYPKT